MIVSTGACVQSALGMIGIAEIVFLYQVLVNALGVEPALALISSASGSH
jgi:hypothetical protein